ncbi:MAG TPA: hypothetical protein VKF36_19280 [Syntrophorhabdales bacterium]|nr:hypothetical protein [Syntrophorhabdales bacterium]
MATSQPKEQIGTARNTSDMLGQPDGSCKILPFRQARSRKSPRDDEPDRNCLASVSPDESPLEQRRGFLTACLPEHCGIVSCHGWGWGMGDQAGSTCTLPTRWLKRVLLMSIFTAWTAAAIALSIALG